MLRFQPDDWLLGLLRPFILADPHGYIYLEVPAPDLRFAVLALLTVALMAIGRIRSQLTPAGWRTLLGLWIAFYAWTFGIGNGRYFIAGLVIVGPLIVLLVALLPATRPMRLLLLTGVIGLQALLLQLHFHHGLWAMAFWRAGPGLGLPNTPLRHQPAVFITVSSISHSILVPRFHPQSRWTSLVEEGDFVPGWHEFDRLQSLLSTPMSKYLITPVVFKPSLTRGRPTEDALDRTLRRLARYGLERTDQPCEELRSGLQIPDPMNIRGPELSLAYWVCQLQNTKPLDDVQAQAELRAWDDTFRAVEERCPRFFPVGSARSRSIGGMVVRNYTHSDTVLFIDESGLVSFRNVRALNPTPLGSADRVRHGDFAIDCQQLPGRYVPPWQR